MHTWLRMHTEEFDPEVGRKPQFEAPAIAGIMRQMHARPQWQLEDPLQVDEPTFEEALREMIEIQRRQGRTIASAPWIKQRNFLLRGVAVVMNG